MATITLSLPDQSQTEMATASRQTCLASTTESDPRWAQVMARDAGADGHFFYSVASTGVYCRPSCGARHPRPQNVRFHATREEAEAAGFRPCKRCKPDQPPLAEQYATKVAEACRLIEAADSLPTLDSLAVAVGISASHFHRIFIASSSSSPASRHGPMPLPTVPVAFVTNWVARQPSPRPSSRPASIPAAAFMKRPTRCWA